MPKYLVTFTRWEPQAVAMEIMATSASDARLRARECALLVDEFKYAADTAKTPKLGPMKVENV